MSPKDPLLQPIAVGNVVLKNRVYSTGHAPSGLVGGDGIPTEAYARYQEEKARGGLGLLVIGGSSNVAVDSANVFDQISAHDDRVLPFYEDLSERVHAFDCRLMIQITHLGRRSRGDIGPWIPPVAPSRARERAHRSFPREMTGSDFSRIAASFADAAVRAQRGGLDGVEVAALAGHLLDSFWSRRSNLRTDEHGGSVQNRTRFTLQVLETIREAVGSEFVMGIRIPGDEAVRGGLTEDDCVEIAEILDGSGFLDFFSVIAGAANTDAELSRMMPGFGRPLGRDVPIAGAIKKATALPIFHAGRIADTATARYALQSGYVDVVGMTRAHIADPDVVAKVLARQEERIRPCVGANMCTSSALTSCLHNPSTGRDAVLPQRITVGERPGKTVVVVGGGVAGLEAARVSALRGHSVTLFEAADQFGGQVRLASRGTRQSEKLSIVDWLATEAVRAGAILKKNTYAEADDVRALDPDLVVIASGGLPDTGVVVTGENLLTSTWDVLGRSVIAGRRTLVWDGTGGEQALTAAEWLVKGGALVDFATPDRMPGQDVPAMNYPDYLAELYQRDVAFRPDVDLHSVRREGSKLVAVLENTFTHDFVEETYDDVVVEHGTLPIDEVWAELAPESVNLGELDPEALVAYAPQTREPNPGGRFRLYRIGDAIASRNIHAAILDARRLCMHF